MACATDGEAIGSEPRHGHSCASEHHCGRGSARALVVGFIAVMCGFSVAVVLALLAVLVAALLHVDAVGIFTIGGSTFGACLTLELGLVGLYAAFRRNVL